MKQGDEVALLVIPQTTSCMETGGMSQAPWAGGLSAYIHAILIFLKPAKGGCVHLNMTKKKKNNLKSHYF